MSKLNKPPLSLDALTKSELKSDYDKTPIGFAEMPIDVEAIAKFALIRYKQYNDIIKYFEGVKVKSSDTVHIGKAPEIITHYEKIEEKTGTKTIGRGETNMSKNKEILIKDLHGKPIREGQEFKFKYLESLHNPINLKGKFCWHNDELRYEIDIIGSEEYTCLSYVNNGVMYDFELLATEEKRI